MGATSVTGVGHGSAEASSRGPKTRGFVGAEKVLGPRIMASGTVTLSGGAGTVVLPAFSGVTADYIVLCQDSDGAAACSASLAITSNATTITFAGNTTHELHYAVVKVGLS